MNAAELFAQLSARGVHLTGVPAQLVALIVEDRTIHTAKRLGLRADMCDRTIRRAFEAANLPRVREWVRLVMLLRATEYMHSHRNDIVHKAAYAAGYADGFTFSNAAYAATGMRPSDIRRLRAWTDVLDAWIANRISESVAA